jgi:hypothetical protein
MDVREPPNNHFVVGSCNNHSFGFFANSSLESGPRWCDANELGATCAWLPSARRPWQSARSRARQHAGLARRAQGAERQLMWEEETNRRATTRRPICLKMTQPGHRAERQANLSCREMCDGRKICVCIKPPRSRGARSIRKRRALLCAFASIAQLLIADSFQERTDLGG